MCVCLCARARVCVRDAFCFNELLSGRATRGESVARLTPDPAMLHQTQLGTPRWACAALPPRGSTPFLTQPTLSLSVACFCPSDCQSDFARLRVWRQTQQLVVATGLANNSKHKSLASPARLYKAELMCFKVLTTHSHTHTELPVSLKCMSCNREYLERSDAHTNKHTQ